MLNKDTISDIFFDLDHTLWDFERNSALTFNQLLTKYDIKIPIEVFLNSYVPVNLTYWKLYREERINKMELRYQRLKQVFDILDYPVSDNFIHTLSDDYINTLPENNFLFEGTLEVLDALKPQYTLHIITNGFRDVQRFKIINAGLNEYFVHIIDSESTGVKKPNPIIFKYALACANINPEQGVMIGDSHEADILGAQAVGMQAIHFAAANEPQHNDCIMINHLKDLLKLL